MATAKTDGVELNGRIVMTSKLKHCIDIKEIVATEIIAKIPAGYRYDYMERVESPDGGTTVRIHTKKERTNENNRKRPV